MGITIECNGSLKQIQFYSHAIYLENIYSEGGYGIWKVGVTITYRGILAFSRSSSIQVKEINQHKNGQSFAHSKHGQKIM